MSMQIKNLYFVIFGEINFVLFCKIFVLFTISKSKVCSKECEFAFPVNFLPNSVLEIPTFLKKCFSWNKV